MLVGLVICRRFVSSNNKQITQTIMNNLNFKIENLKVGTIVTYVNGSPAIYTGKIVKITSKPTFIIININDEDGFILRNSCIPYGSDIQLDQIKSIVKA